MPRRTFRVDIAYRGAGFVGFSRQKDQRTVEGTILKALQTRLPRLRRLACAGRTDRGVHAEGQVISFYTHTAIQADAVAACINQAAPGEISCYDCVEVARSFHATFAACARRYRYVLSGAAAEAESLNTLVNRLEGLRCFSAFARDTKRPSQCKLEVATVRQEGDDAVFYFQADRFLKRQVRVMVATALRESRLSSPQERLVDLAADGDRGATAKAADPDGLTLVGVAYKQDDRLHWSGPPELWL